MSPSIYKFLVEGAELLHQESNSVERLMQYLDENLITLKNQLNEDNFEGFLNIIWDSVAGLLSELLESSLEVSKSFKVQENRCCSGSRFNVN